MVRYIISKETVGLKAVGTWDACNFATCCVEQIDRSRKQNREVDAVGAVGVAKITHPRPSFAEPHTNRGRDRSSVSHLRNAATTRHVVILTCYCRIIRHLHVPGFMLEPLTANLCKTSIDFPHVLDGCRRLISTTNQHRCPQSHTISTTT